MTRQAWGPPPQRLLEETGVAGTVVRQAQDIRPVAGLEATAWNRLERRLDSQGWRPHPLVLALAAAAVVTAVVFLVAGFKPRASPATAVTVAASGVVEPTLVPGRELPAGASALADGTRLLLSERGRATVESPRRGHRRIVLARGSLALAVTPQQEGQGLEIAAGGYVFRVVGTEFTVALREGGTRLEVEAGKVSVLEGSRQLALVTAGGRWESPAPSTLTAAPSASPAPATSHGLSAAPEQDCLALARQGHHRDALGCFTRQAQGSGLEAEIALYEGARLRRDVLGDPNGALATLRESQRRFPNGTFRTEAAVTVVEILAARGDREAALAEVERLLASGAARERTAELRALRARLLRETDSLDHAPVGPATKDDSSAK